MTQITAKVIEHSISSEGKELLTYQLAYPRFIHSEFLTHRVFSRNASSSRAIPVAKMIEQVRTNPAMPVHWGKNQPGMQAAVELTGNELDIAKSQWHRAAWQAANIAEEMSALGAHKQVVNRILEPFQIIHVIVTATEWDNFFELRAHPDAQPEIRVLAEVMLAARASSKPVLRISDADFALGWHLPYVTQQERAEHATSPFYLAKLSAARCARVSYLTHDGKQPDPAKDLELYERLVGSRPLHASPVEHQAYPDRLRMEGDLDDGWVSHDLHGNFVGWVQYRKLVEKSV